jgi:hypothetical protein
MRYARGWHERIMATRSFVKWESFYTGYFIYVRCTNCLIDARSLNLKACPIGSRHVYFCDELVPSWLACRGYILVINNTVLLTDHSGGIQQEPDSSKTDVFDRIMNKITYNTIDRVISTD